MKSAKKLCCVVLVFCLVFADFFCFSVSADEKKLIFDSAVDFSGVQGQDSWYYKFRKIEDGVDGELNDYVYRKANNRWYPTESTDRSKGMLCSPTDGGSYTANVMFAGTYANENDSVIYSSVKEFVSPYSGIAEIGATNFSGRSKFGRMYARVLLNGEKIWPSNGEWHFHSGSGKVEFKSFNIGLNKGDILDFEVKRGQLGEGEDDVLTGKLSEQGLIWTPSVSYNKNFAGVKNLYTLNGNLNGWTTENEVSADGDKITFPAASEILFNGSFSDSSLSLKIIPSKLDGSVEIVPTTADTGGYSVRINSAGIEILKDKTPVAAENFSFGENIEYEIGASVHTFENGIYIFAGVNGDETLSYFDRDEFIAEGGLGFSCDNAVNISGLKIGTTVSDENELLLIEAAESSVSAAEKEISADTASEAFAAINALNSALARAVFEARMIGPMSGFSYIKASADTASRAVTFEGICYGLRNTDAQVTLTNGGYSENDIVTVNEMGAFSGIHILSESADSGKYTISLNENVLNGAFDYRKASSECELISFYADGVKGSINGQNVTVNLTKDTDIKSIVAVFEIPPYAKAFVGDVLQESAVTANDFSDSVEYRITAENGSEKIYNVKINLNKETTGGRGGSKSSGSKGSQLGMTVSKTDAVIKPNDAQTDADKKESFPDVPKTHYAFEYIEKLRNLGIVCGDENGKFNLDEKITRAEFVKLIVTALKLDTTTENVFDDVKNSDWFYKYVNTAYSSKLVMGVSEKEFAPREYVTKQDTAVILCRAYAEFEQGEKSADFSDKNDISDYAKNAVDLLYGNGIISGENGKFNPKNYATRAQTAKMLAMCIR